MNISKTTAALAATLVLAALPAQLHAADKSDETVLFADDFNRADGDSVANGWVKTVEFGGDVILKDSAALFQPEDGDYEPRISHTFAEQTSGKFTASFRMDWRRDFEEVWGLYMQLGSSKAFKEKMSDDDHLNTGAAVNLVWGGSWAINSEEFAVFAHVAKGKFKKLANVNNNEAKETIVENPIVTIEVDMDKKTYTVSLAGKTYKDLAFDNDLPIDSIRFIAHKCRPDNFPHSSIDDVKIVKKK